MRNFGRELSPYYASLAQMHPHCTPKELAQLVCLETARLAVRCREQGMPRIVGFDLAGAERNHPPHHYTQAFYQIINALMNITVHAGEAYGPESVRQAVCYLGANRIGHGTRLVGKQAQKLVDYIRDHRILVEVCLTSNLQTKAVSHLSRHPFKEFLDSEVRVTLCTDNRLISDTTVTNELFLATRAYNLNAHDVRRTILYGFKGAFLPYDKRRKLLLEARAELRTLGLRSEDGYH
jgi:adenosine deaminase